MEGMFLGYSHLVRLDLSNFDTSNVTNMASMFRNNYALEELDLTSFNTSNVTDMSGMFCVTRGLKEIRVSNLWDMSSVTNTTDMFVQSGVSSVTVV